MVIRKKITIANENTAGSMDDGNAPPDHVRPFMLDTSGVRGRIVRLPTVINDILTAHNYPDAVARIMAEGICLTTLLAGMLKFDGIFTLQVKSDGILRTLVCDITTDGTVRGYASYDAEALQDDMAYAAPFAALTAIPEDSDTSATGGYLAFTVDQANTADRYQGIVALRAGGLTESVERYFDQSEQIRTGFVSQVAKDADGVWQGAAMMLQQMPDEDAALATALAHNSASAEEKKENWDRSMILMQTLHKGEMLDMDTPVNTLLYRLFHEEVVRVFDPIAITKGCRCSEEKISAVMDNLSDDDKSDLAEDGVISVTCEFCGKTYRFPVN